MAMTSRAASAAPDTPTDEEIAQRVLSGEVELFELLMRRHNQRIYRSVRSLVRDETEVEDVMQQAYLAAYQNLAQFHGAARFSTWLTRIAINEALMRLRRARPLVVLDGGIAEEETMLPPRPDSSPEEAASRREVLGLLEHALDGLPELYRSVFVLREVEGLSTAEAAEVLDATEDVVKTRLHRAKGLLRDRLSALAQPHVGELFAFHAPRCDRVVANVMARIKSR